VTPLTMMFFIPLVAASMYPGIIQGKLDADKEKAVETGSIDDTDAYLKDLSQEFGAEAGQLTAAASSFIQTDVKPSDNWETVHKEEAGITKDDQHFKDIIAGFEHHPDLLSLKKASLLQTGDAPAKAEKKTAAKAEKKTATKAEKKTTAKAEKKTADEKKGFADIEESRNNLGSLRERMAQEMADFNKKADGEFTNLNEKSVHPHGPPKPSSFVETPKTQMGVKEMEKRMKELRAKDEATAKEAMATEAKRGEVDSDRIHKLMARMKAETLKAHDKAAALKLEMAERRKAHPSSFVETKFDDGPDSEIQASMNQAQGAMKTLQNLEDKMTAQAAGYHANAKQAEVEQQRARGQFATPSSLLQKDSPLDGPSADEQLKQVGDMIKQLNLKMKEQASDMNNEALGVEERTKGEMHPLIAVPSSFAETPAYKEKTDADLNKNFDASEVKLAKLRDHLKKVDSIFKTSPSSLAQLVDSTDQDENMLAGWKNGIDNLEHQEIGRSNVFFKELGMALAPSSLIQKFDVPDDVDPDSQYTTDEEAMFDQKLDKLRSKQAGKDAESVNDMSDLKATLDGMSSPLMTSSALVDVDSIGDPFPTSYLQREDNLRSHE